MRVKINGECREITASASIAALLAELGYTDAFLAVALNHDCVPRSRYSVQKVTENDEIEILAPMSGG